MTAATPFCTATAAATTDRTEVRHRLASKLALATGLTCSRLSTALRRNTRSLQP